MLRIASVLIAIFTSALTAEAQERPTFKEFPVEVMELETLAMPYILPGSWIEEYREEIEVCAEETGINFGSRLTSCYVSVGPDSQLVFVIDRAIGLVQFLIETRAGFETRAGSLLFVANTDQESILQYVDADSIPDTFQTKYFYFYEDPFVLEGIEE